MTSRARTLAFAIAAGAVLIALIANFALGVSGGSPGFVRFLGRFHTLAVHLPIGVILLVALAEGISLVPGMRERVDGVAGGTLAAFVLSSVAAFVLGLLLAREGGYPDDLIGPHRALTLIAVLFGAGGLVLWTLHQQSGNAPLRWAYRGVLGVTLLLLTVGAHFGGSMTRGEDYLTRYAPWRSESATPAAASAKPATPAADQRVFADLVQPILNDKCLECHGPEKSKGDLRVDSLEALMKGGEGGPAIVSGKSEKSPLVTRMLLPPEHDERMPPEGKPQPTEGEIALIRWWVDGGASPELKVAAALPPDGALALLKKAAESAPKPAAQGAGAASGDDDADEDDPDADEDDEEGDDEEVVSGDDDDEDEGDLGDLDEDISFDDIDLGGDDDDDDGESGTVSASASGGGGGGTSLWDAKVLPLLEARCASCHGAKKQKGKLRVDSIAALMKGGKEGPAVVPGNPKGSPLLKRIHLPLSDSDHMPPKTRKQLTASEVELLELWVKQGGNADVKLSALPSSAKAAPIVSSDEDADAEDDASEDDADDSSGDDGDDAADDDDAGDDDDDDDAAAAVAAAGGASGGGTAAKAVPGASVGALPEHVRLFADVVAPILKDRCASCHSGESAMGDFVIDDTEKLISEGSVVPGKPDDSELLGRMELPMKDEGHMPPESMPQPGREEIAAVRFWIERGAKFDGEVPREELPGPVAAAALAKLSPQEKPAPETGDGQPGGGAASQPPGKVAGSGGCACTVRGAPSDPGLWARLALPARALLVRRRRAEKIARG